MAENQFLLRIEKEISDTEKQIAALKIRLQTLKDAREFFNQASGPLPGGFTDTLPLPVVRGHSEPSPSVVRPRPGAAIKSFVSAHPGTTAPVVISALVDLVETKSGDKERLLRNTIRNLVYNKVLRRDEKERLWIDESEVK